MRMRWLRKRKLKLNIIASPSMPMADISRMRGMIPWVRQLRRRKWLRSISLLAGILQLFLCSQIRMDRLCSLQAGAWNRTGSLYRLWKKNMFLWRTVSCTLCGRPRRMRPGWTPMLRALVQRILLRRLMPQRNRGILGQKTNRNLLKNLETPNL